MRRGPYKPCFKCRGIGKHDEKICPKCAGYGSISLKIIQQGLKRTNEGTMMIVNSPIEALK